MAVFLAGEPNLLPGPTASGLLGTVPWAVLAGWLLWRRKRLAPATAVDWP